MTKFFPTSFVVSSFAFKNVLKHQKISGYIKHSFSMALVEKVTKNIESMSVAGHIVCFAH